MSFNHILWVMALDRSTRNGIRTTLKLANSAMAVAGIATLLYSIWMTVVCLRDYQKYHFPWFLWACIAVGAVFCFTACIGHTAADSRNDCFLSFYILVLFLLLLAEILIAADVFLNDDWDKDFPKDPTHRFKDFVDFADDNEEVFSFLAFVMFSSQVVSLILAMILRTMHHNHRSLIEHHHDDQVSVHVPAPPPYVVGHPQFPLHTNALGEPFLEKDSSIPYPEKPAWAKGGAAGYPPLHH